MNLDERKKEYQDKLQLIISSLKNDRLVVRDSAGWDQATDFVDDGTVVCTYRCRQGDLLIGHYGFELSSGQKELVDQTIAELTLLENLNEKIATLNEAIGTICDPRDIVKAKK